MKPLRTAFAAAALAAAFTALPAQADYNPSAATRDEVIAQMNHITNSLGFMEEDLMSHLANLQAEPIAEAPGNPKSCYTLKTTVNYGFNYGPGQINTTLLTLDHVAAREENGRLVPAEAPHHFADIRDFGRAYSAEVNKGGYIDVSLPRDITIGCDEKPDIQRANLSNTNFQLASIFTMRVRTRMYIESSALLERLGNLAKPQPAPKP